MVNDVDVESEACIADAVKPGSVWSLKVTVTPADATQP